MRILILACSLLIALATPVTADELTWRKDIQPIVQANCAACHGADAPIFEDWEHDRDRWAKQNTGPRMDTYAYFMRHVVWPATGSVMRRLDDGKGSPDGKPGNMHQFLGATGEERARNLQTIKSWLGEGAWNLNRWKARGNVSPISKEQLDKIKAQY